MTRFYFKDELKRHFGDNAYRYYLVLFVSLVAIALGIYLSVSDVTITSLLSSADKNMFNYIKGTASYSSIFSARILNILLCILIIFLFNIFRETAFLNYIYLGYQMCLVVLSAAAIIILYSVAGIVNVILFILPINLINYGLLVYISVISMHRAAYRKHYKTTFRASFKETGYISKFVLSVLALVVFCLIYSFILPLIFKSFVVINY